MRITITGTQLEYALLGLIRQGVSSGYALRKKFASTPMGHFSDSPGSIYPALGRLERRGWVRRLDGPAAPRRRQSYCLTQRGASALRKWLATPLHRGDVAHDYHGLLLRFAFMESAGDRNLTVSFLRAFERQAAEYAAELRSFLKAIPYKDVPTGWLALENGLMQFETQARWARRAMARPRRLR